MIIDVKFIDNPEHFFWIWEKKFSNMEASKSCPTFQSTVASGKTVAIYQCEKETRTQIAQLSYPDYNLLKEKYDTGEAVDLSYTYIDNFTWLGTQSPNEIENEPYKKCKSFNATASFWNDAPENGQEYLIMQAEILENDMDFSYAGFNNINMYIHNIKITSGNLQFDHAHFDTTTIYLISISCGGNRYYSPEISFKYAHSDLTEIQLDILNSNISIDFFLFKMQRGISN
jgi:hypothetical protein